MQSSSSWPRPFQSPSSSSASSRPLHSLFPTKPSPFSLSLTSPSSPLSFNLRCIPNFPSSAPPPPPSSSTAAVKSKRKRYRKAYPGEAKGIVEEMRFVAMKLRTDTKIEALDDHQDAETWRPSMEGFVKYLVDSKLVFETLERIIGDSTDVAYTHFRKTGLERSACISNDLEWLEKQGIAIPQPSSPGITYAQYLEELADKSAPSFLCHLYNNYFAHISGGQAIGKQVCEMLLQGKELEFYKWEGDVQESLKGVREKLNMLGEHWSRDEKNRCLREASKSFRFSGQIIRLIIL